MRATTPSETKLEQPSSPTESTASESNSTGKLPVNMSEDFSFMKEGDAAILERGVEAPEVDGSFQHQYQENSALSLPQGSVPDLNGTQESFTPIKGPSRPSSRVDEEQRPISPGFIRGLMAQQSPQTPTPPGQVGARGRQGAASNEPINDSCSESRLLYRRCLSGDVRPYAERPDSVEDNDEEHFSEWLASEELLPEALETGNSAEKLRSSRSIERMMNEAAQFAEAVGELPPTDQSEVQFIIEGDGSQDSDDETSPEVEVRTDEELLDGKARNSDQNEIHVHIGELVEVPTDGDSLARRRLNEAQQFAEALGEIPPTSEDDVQVIIDSEESDDEASIEGIVVEQPVVSSAIIESLDAARPSEKDSKEQDGEHRHHRMKSRPRWPFKQSIETSRGYLHKLPDGVATQDFEYKGICSNPPEITKSGIQRGNYAQLHRKAWLEVSDKYHRYGKNLRLYYRYWERLGFPSNSFFDWLDSKGDCAGEPLPNLPECPRSQLDSDTVLYVTNPDVTESYVLDIVPDEKGRGRVFDVDGEPVKTGSDGWIFVVRDNALYGAQKVTSISGHSKQRFHHSSFFGGKAVAAAGIIITDDDGILFRQYPHSGHYRPGEADIQRMLFFLHHKGVDLRTFDFDTQQIFHVARGGDTVTTADGTAQEKKKKVQSLHLTPAFHVACFLAHKARFIEKGIFAQIHRIRQSDATSVSEALDLVDDGGYWKRVRRDLFERSGSGAV